jgi:beta-phosphoglucomutase
MKYFAIIFDMDGTIINTEGIWEKATQEFIAKRHGAITPEQKKTILEKTHGLHLKASCAVIKETLGLNDDVESIIHELSTMANNAYVQGVTFIEGFETFHASLEPHNLKTGLATNAHDSTVSITKKTHNLEKFFGRHIYNVSHVNNVGKPHPALYLHAAKEMGVKPEHCVVIEDSAHGIRAAKSAGMFCIGINTSKKRDNLKEADFIIDGYHEIDLKKLLKKN